MKWLLPIVKKADREPIWRHEIDRNRCVFTGRRIHHRRDRANVRVNALRGVEFVETQH